MSAQKAKTSVNCAKSTDTDEMRKHTGVTVMCLLSARKLFFAQQFVAAIECHSQHGVNMHCSDLWAALH